MDERRRTGKIAPGLRRNATETHRNKEPRRLVGVIEAADKSFEREANHMPAILMWLIGIPIPIIILLYLLT